MKPAVRGLLAAALASVALPSAVRAQAQWCSSP
jgi:hypothetical protein